MSTDPLFHMVVEDVFSIRERGTVVTGTIDTGTLNSGDEISIQRPGSSKKAVVSGIEMFRKQLSQAQAGNLVGVLLRDITKEDVQKGDVLSGSDLDFSWNQ